MRIGTASLVPGDARITADVPRDGANSRMTCKFTRSSADSYACFPVRLARRPFAGSLVDVVAGLPQGSGAHSPNRYPSPDGRPRAILRRSPFFLFNSECYNDRQSAAQTAVAWLSGIANAGDSATRGGTFPIQGTRGSDQCSHHIGQVLPAFSYSPLAGAAAPFPNRPFSVRVPVRAPRLCLTATSPQAPSSVRPAISPIARHSRIAVCDPARALRVNQPYARRAQFSQMQPSVRVRAPVAFSSLRPGHKSRGST